MSNEITTTEAPKGALNALASRLEMNPKRTSEVLRNTAFKACKNDDQFAALVIVANTYGLNPLLKELYAFPGKGGEIVPIVSIDGWLRIINDHPQMDGMSETWAEDGSWCEITIHRKDRNHPTVHREYFEEVKRNTEPWKQHPRRMLKWKTIIQAGRVAFGFGGLHDEDEGKDVAGIRNVTPKSGYVRDEVIEPGAPAPEPEPEEKPEPKKTRQKKERHQQEVTFLDVTERSSNGKTWWAASVQTAKGATVEMNTFSTSLSKRLSELFNGDKIVVTFTQTPKGGFALEDFDQVEGEEGDSDE